MIYQPEWDHKDKPRISCPHIKGIRIGSEYCEKDCVWFVRWIKTKTHHKVECGFEEEINADK